MYVRAAKRVKISSQEVRDAALLGKLGDDSAIDTATTGIDLPFDGQELACWTQKNRISEMTVSELVSGIKVRNFHVLHSWLLQRGQDLVPVSTLTLCQ